MTFVGKILVVVIACLAFIFLGLSAVVFTTATNWKERQGVEQKKHADTKQKLADAKAEADKAEGETKAAKSEFATATKAQEQRIEALEAETKSANDQAADSAKKLGLSEQNAKISLDEATAYKKETDQLREQKAEVEKQANEYKLRQTELNDKIRELERINETAKKNNKEFKEKNAKLSTALRAHGLSDNVEQYAAIEAPPQVEGEVKKVDKFNKSLELSIGSDDGLVPGHELYLFRTKPRAEYLGKIKIQSVDPDQAVAKVIGTTIQGKKIQEGDVVSSTINRPRG